MSTGGKIGIGFAVGMTLLAVIGVDAYLSTHRLLEANRQVTHTHEVIEGLEQVLSVLKDAETGQRGFLVTGEQRYLELYSAAVVVVPRHLNAVAELTHDDPGQRAKLQEVRTLATSKLVELRETIELRKTAGFAAAAAMVRTDRGKQIMDDLRRVVADMESREQGDLERHAEAANTSAARTLWATALWIPLALVVLSVVAVVLMRTVRLDGSTAPPPTLGRRLGSLALQYGAAVVAVAVAVVAREALLESVGPMPLFITFYPAVLLVASVGGGGPGILATGLSALAADYWFISPYGAFSIDTPHDCVATGIFVVVNLGLCVLAERLRRARWAEALSVAQEQQLDEMSRLNEELLQQSEKLSQQSEELAQQNEELQSQSEEIQTLNADLRQREGMLQNLLDAAHLSSAEQDVLSDVCGAALEMLGPAASAVMVLEPEGDRLVVRGRAGLGPAGTSVASLPCTKSFVDIVIGENRTAALPDASLRPDLSLVSPPGEQPYRAVLTTPLRRNGKPFAVLGIYSHRKQDWTAEQFRLGEWLAAQCAHIMEILRLQEQLRRQAALIDLSPDAILVRRMDDTITFWSHGAELLYGWTKDEALGQWSDRLFQTQLPEPLETIVEKLKRDGRWSGELVHRTKDSRKIVVEGWWIAQLDPQGEVVEILESNVDITDRKRMEEALERDRNLLRALIDNLPDYVYVKDLQCRFLAANLATARIMGAASPDELLGRVDADFYPSELAAEYGDQEAELLRTGKPILDKDEPHVDAEGNPRTVLTTKVPLKNHHGDIVGLVGISRDITDRKEAENALRRTAEELARSNRDLEQFAYVASHDLQEPLRMVTGFLQLLHQKYSGRLDTDADQYIDFAVDGAKRMQALIADLLTYARVGTRSRQLMLVDVATSFSQTLRNLGAGIDETRAEITHGELPTVWADGIQLSQLFQNLISNALKFRRGVPPQIHVDAHHDPTQWTFSVRDNGIGIDREFQDRIFMIFQRLHTRQEYPGTGIGLAVCKKIVERHGGQIWVESIPGEGSTFYFTIPDREK
jgi:PAS domain S-box-containing protein